MIRRPGFSRRAFNTGLLAGTAAAALPLPAYAQKKGGVAVVAQSAPPPTIDAQTSSAAATRNISLHVHETLFARDENANPVPDLAEGVDMSADGLSYKFTLRSGVNFHNGKVMTSADVKASLERYARVGMSKFFMAPVDAIETPDSKTVTVRLKNIFPGFIENLSSPRAPCAIMPEEECAKPAGEGGRIGTGPFTMGEFRSDSHIMLHRFENYSPNNNYKARDGFAGRKTAYFDSLRIRFMPEGGARTAGLQTGELHVIEALDAPVAKRLESDRNIRSYTMMPWAYQTLIMNNAWGQTQSLPFRRAIQAALDLEEIMAISTSGLYRMQPAWQHPGTQHFPGVEGLAKYQKQDQARAREYLKEAGYNGEEFPMMADNTNRPHIDTATVVSEQLRAVGIKVKLSVTDWPTIFTARTKPEGWCMWPLLMGIEPYEGPYGVVGFFAGASTSIMKPDPVLEQAQAKLTTSLKLEDRIAAVKMFQDRMYDQALSIKVGDSGWIQATRANVINFAPYRIPRMWDVWFA
jgi:peptide/nickel transport system substrate-binding protein